MKSRVSCDSSERKAPCRARVVVRGPPAVEKKKPKLHDPREASSRHVAVYQC